MSCDNCRLRRYSERKSDSWIARLWRWHTGWCLGWKRYQKRLAEQAGKSQEDQPR